MTRIIVGIMGPGDGASAHDCDRAAQLAGLVAAEGWILLTGGRSAGVMEAASAAATRAGGLTIGILPGTDWTQASSAVAVAILTGVGEARDNINVLSSRVIFVCGISAGTAAEVALACKAGRLTLYYDWLQPRWLDGAVRELAARGYDPVIVIEAAEEPAFRDRFGELNTLGRLDWPAAAELASPVRVRIYDPADRERFRRGDRITTRQIQPWTRFR